MSALFGKYVLVIEDEALISLELTDLLKGYDAKVVGPLHDSAAALSYIRSTAIDCAVLDTQLGTGADVSAVADTWAQAEVPFIFVTAYADHDILSRYPSRPVVKKPYEQRDVIAALSAVLASTCAGTIS